MAGSVAAAVHEAGHAVVAHVLGVEVRRVALHDRGGGITELDSTDVRRALLIAVAGAAAEKVCRAPDPEVAWRL